tara:strand:+ start:166 stop:321 length:156 start_codon:yes stop_codon:yes gene_type:complete
VDRKERVRRRGEKKKRREEEEESRKIGQTRHATRKMKEVAEEASKGVEENM